MAAVVRWVNPPVGKPVGKPTGTFDHSGPFDSKVAAAALRQRPGEWALVAVHPGGSVTAHMIRWGRIQAWHPKWSFDSTSRTVNDGLVAVYARYVGDGGAL